MSQAKISDFSYDTDTDKRVTALTSAYILTSTADIRNLILNGVMVNGISWDATENDIRKLVTAKALRDTIIDVNKKISDIDPHNNLYQDNTVITLPICDSSFADYAWEANNWKVVQGNYASYTGNAIAAKRINYLKLKNYPFTRKGNYLISIEIEALDSGKLVIYNESDEKIAEAIVPGTFNTLYAPESPDSATLKLVAENVFDKETIRIKHVYIYYITSRLEHYLNFVVPYITSGGEGYASIEYVQRIREQILLDLEEKFSQLPNLTNLSLLLNHIKDVTGNPHHITCEMIKAAPVDHTHTPDKVGAAPVGHTHVPADINAADREHTHTPESIGAANVDHTHDPEDIGAAPTIHTHDQYMSKDEAKEEIESLIGSVQGGLAVSRPLISRYGGDYIKQNVGYFPELNIPTPVFWPDHVIHRYKQPLDPISGYSYSNTPRADGTGSYDAFFTPIQGENTPYALFNVLPDEDNPITVGYKLHVMRDFMKYVVRWSTNENMTHRPSSWVVKYRNRVLDTQTDVTPEDNAAYLEVELEEVENVRDITFEFTDMVALVEGDVASPKWGVHIEIYFDTRETVIDVDSGEPVLVEGSKLTVLSNDNVFTHGGIEGDMKTFTIPVQNVKIKNMSADTYLHIRCDEYIGETQKEYTLQSVLCPPEYGYKREGIPLFANHVFNDEYTGNYGTLSIPNMEDPDSLLSSGSIKNLYSYPMAYDFEYEPDIEAIKNTNNKKLITNENVTTLTIEHTNIPNLNLLGWVLYIDPEDERKGYCPTKLTITYTRSTENYEGHDDENPVVPQEDEYDREIISGEIDPDTKILTYTATLTSMTITSRYVDPVEDFSFYDALNSETYATPITDVTSLLYTFENTVGDRIGIFGIQPLFTEDFYDINRNILYDRNNKAISNRVYVGSARVFRNNRNALEVYPFITPIGIEHIVPLDYITLAYSDDNLIEIANPFYSKRISITPCENVFSVFEDINKLRYAAPCIRVKDVTPERITMVVQKGLRAVVVRRLW